MLSLRYTGVRKDNLIIPERFAVADLKGGGFGIGKARDGEPQVDARVWALCDSSP